MIADVILGLNIDTEYWIENLLEEGADYIIVLDYSYYGEPFEKNDILYISSMDIKEYLKKFDEVKFYKSLYAYPGMSGNMSSLFKE